MWVNSLSKENYLNGKFLLHILRHEILQEGKKKERERERESTNLKHFTLEHTLKFIL